MELLAQASAIFDAICVTFMIAMGIAFVGAGFFAARATRLPEAPKTEKEEGVFVEGHFV